MKYILFILFPLLISAQTHRFIFEYQYKNDSLAKEFTKDNMILDINPDDVKFYPYIYAEKDSINKIQKTRSFIWEENLPALTRKRNSNLNTTFVLLNDFFKIESKDEMTWELSSETKTIGNYKLQNAATKFGGRNWTAWFNSEITLNEGPYKFRGLPGLIFDITDDKQNFKFTLIKSYQLKETYNTEEILETFAGEKSILVSQKTLLKKQLELFNDPLQDFKEDFKSATENTIFWVMGTQVKSIDQFKELSQQTQDQMRKENNPIELDKAIHYPKK
ncbi:MULTISPECIES: GLPGLI family protein [unclassified Kaistella]|uniref:GLPGLI family protein n=1 Tax=unclassified Kaistella TaxID=2762626 RepID=UPI0027365CC8|nr:MULTISPECIES: GLPGLI family protein [unclassified Kaistella]MDP2454360.1 GLPGLI family protein [Kaistella sp. SH11-4b]MDP2457847.1 GLPGLI family protein [Kaistella sp. SH40-3]MDP2460753.1 GLPGLI family protein [Kaistella sp. SH19-2b]